MLVRVMREPSTTEGRRVRGELRDLLETAIVQQAESSASRRCENISKRPSVQDRLKAPSVHDRCEAQEDHDMVSRRRRHDNDGLARGYHPHRGGRYDSGEDRSPSPRPPGPRVFSKAIRGAPFPARFRQPANLAKYSGETNPELWLADYRLACQLGGASDDLLIIRNLPLFLSDSARAWLEHLNPSQIHNWRDLVKVFIRNFQGTYVRPGNSWDLKSCR